MALLSVASPLGVSEAFNLTSIPATDVSQEKGFTSCYMPLSDPKNGNGPIEFLVQNTGTKYINLSETALYVRFVIKDSEGNEIKYKAGNLEPADDNDVVTGVANILNSLFTSTELYLNGVSVSSPILNSHAYIDYLKKLLNYSKESKNSILTCSGFYADSTTGYASRRKLTANNESEWIGRLDLDLFSCQKYLLSNVEMKLRLNRSSDKFFLHTKNQNKEYSVSLKEAKLFIRYIAPSDQIIEANEKILQTQKALYPYQRQLMKTFQLSQGDLDFSTENLFTSYLPEKIVLGFLDSEAYLGDQKKDPFNFENMEVTNINFFVDHERVIALDLDYTSNKYIEAFYTTLDNLGFGEGAQENNGMSRDNFKDSNNLFCINLLPEKNNETNLALVRKANTRLQIRFKTGLSKPVTLILCYSTPAVVEIDSERNVTHNFSD